MKKLLLASAAILALSAPSYAADLAARPYTKAPAPVLNPGINWSGFYIGAMGGYGWSNSVSASIPGVGGVTVDTDELRGGFGGGTIGYNWQTAPNLVFGIEVDAAAADISYSVGDPAIATFEDKIRSFGSVTGRLGWATGPALLYVKGGFAWANNRMSVSVVAPAFTASESKTHTGWTIGAGIEYMFAPNWSAKAEYMYADYGSERYAGVVDVGATVHTIKAGINYHFNWGTPLAPGY